MTNRGTNTTSKKTRGPIRRVTLCSIAVNLVLAGVKFTVGTLGSSQVLVADAIHSLSDTSTDLAILLGVHFWTAPADRNHPYGHWRIESIITTSISVSLIAVAIGISYRAITTIQHQPTELPGLIAFYGAVVSIVTKELIYRWTIRVAHHTRSSAVIANAWHHRTDALSSVPAALAVLLARIGPKWAIVDHIGAIIVSLFVLHAAWSIIKPAVAELTDSGASPETIDRIKALVLAVDGVRATHAIRTRKVGPGVHLDLHILVDGSLSVREGHAISETVKQLLLEQGPEILDAVVHLEPDNRNQRKNE